MAALRARRSARHRLVRAGAVSVQLEVFVVAAARPLRAARARPPARLDSHVANRAADCIARVRRARPAIRFVGDCAAGDGRRVFQRDPGHRAGRLPARDSLRHRAWPRQLDPRQRVPYRRPGAGFAVADPRRHPAVEQRFLHHRAFHAAGHRHDAHGERTGNRRHVAALAARRGSRTVPRIYLARRPAPGAAHAGIHGAL